MSETTTANAFGDFSSAFINLFKTLGWSKSLTISLFFVACGVISYLLNALIKAKDQEIERLRKDNDNYREIYLAGLDTLKGLSLPLKKNASSHPTPKKAKP